MAAGHAAHGVNAGGARLPHCGRLGRAFAGFACPAMLAADGADGDVGAVELEGDVEDGHVFVEVEAPYGFDELGVLGAVGSQTSAQIA
jgi:hypothetical protein